MKRFRISASFSNENRHKTSPARTIEAEVKPTNADLQSLLEPAAKKELAARGQPDLPLKMTFPSVMELAPLPRLAPGESRPLKHWRITVDFACHDIKYASTASCVFEWPEEPSGEALFRMTYYVMSENIAGRGDDPTWADVAEMNSRKIELTDAPAISFPWPSAPQ